MASFKTVTASGKSICRGHDQKCIAVIPHNDYRKMIPKGTKALEVSVYGAGGGATVYYCEVCLHSVLEAMRSVIEEIEK